VVQGHEHAYARTCPMYRMKCDLDPPSGRHAASAHGQPSPTGGGASGSSRSSHQRSRHFIYTQQDSNEVSGGTTYQWALRAAAQLWHAVAGLAGGLREPVPAGSASMSDTTKGDSGMLNQQQLPVELRRGRCCSEPLRQEYEVPAGGPVYMLAGHAGAGVSVGG
jgi:hypothetical protein